MKVQVKIRDFHKIRDCKIQGKLIVKPLNALKEKTGDRR